MHYILLYKTIKNLPLCLRRLLAKILAFFASLISTKESQILELQSKLCLDGKKISVYSVYKNIFLTIFEALNLKPIMKDSSNLISFPDEKKFTELIKRKKPVIALTGHFGNWDLLAAYMIKIGAPLVTTARKTRNIHLQEVTETMRADYGIKCYWRDGTKESKQKSISEIKKSLETNEVVGGLIDQDTQVSNLHVPFFNIPASTPTGLIALGKKYDAIFITTFCARVASNKYKMFFSEVPKDFGIEEICQFFNNELERIVRMHPEQWVWLHKRFRSLPDGRKLRTKEYIEYLNEKLS